MVNYNKLSSLSRDFTPIFHQEAIEQGAQMEQSLMRFVLNNYCEEPNYKDLLLKKDKDTHDKMENWLDQQCDYLPTAPKVHFYHLYRLMYYKKVLNEAKYSPRWFENSMTPHNTLNHFVYSVITPLYYGGINIDVKTILKTIYKDIPEQFIVLPRIAFSATPSIPPIPEHNTYCTTFTEDFFSVLRSAGVIHQSTYSQDELEKLYNLLYIQK